LNVGGELAHLESSHPGGMGVGFLITNFTPHRQSTAVLIAEAVWHCEGRRVCNEHIHSMKLWASGGRSIASEVGGALPLSIIVLGPIFTSWKDRITHSYKLSNIWGKNLGYLFWSLSCSPELGCLEFDCYVGCLAIFGQMLQNHVASTTFPIYQVFQGLVWGVSFGS
jgi:hypothetical protein